MQTPVMTEMEKVPLHGVTVDVRTRGTGRPLVFLHPEIGLRFSAPWVDAIAKQYRLIAPSHPGFEASELPRWISSIHDLAYVYLDLMDALGLNDVILVGVGFGAWLAAEIAVKSTARIERMVLADAFGIKVSDRLTRDIVDIFATKQSDLLELAYHDPTYGMLDAASMTEDDALALFRNREACALFGWSPYMHNPKLKHRLHRITVPALVLWGESDRIVTPRYGRYLADAIPQSKFEIIAGAGHFPHIEQPQLFAERIAAFVHGSESAKGSLS
jgi:pimeloyl-ACP methyl ester carboxylesterase